MLCENQREMTCVQVIHGAAIGNRDQVLQSSIKLGFLTGYEDKVNSSVICISIRCTYHGKLFPNTNLFIKSTDIK